MRYEAETRGEATSTPKESRNQRWLAAGLILFVVLMLGGLVAGAIYLLQPGAPTETLRDIFIILLALEFMVIGLALVILVIQLARLVNLLQNEVRPILESTNQAVNTLRGTAQFLSEKLVNPVVKVNGMIAALRRAASMFSSGSTKKLK